MKEMHFFYKHIIAKLLMFFHTCHI